MPRIYGRDMDEEHIAKRFIRYHMEKVFDKNPYKDDILIQITNDELSKVNRLVDEIVEKINTKFDLPDML